MKSVVKKKMDAAKFRKWVLLQESAEHGRPSGGPRPYGVFLQAVDAVCRRDWHVADCLLSRAARDGFPMGMIGLGLSLLTPGSVPPGDGNDGFVHVGDDGWLASCFVETLRDLGVEATNVSLEETLGVVDYGIGSGFDPSEKSLAWLLSEGLWGHCMERLGKSPSEALKTRAGSGEGAFHFWAAGCGNCSDGCEEVFVALRDAGASPSMVDAKGDSAAWAAVTLLECEVSKEVGEVAGGNSSFVDLSRAEGFVRALMVLEGAGCKVPAMGGAGRGLGEAAVVFMDGGRADVGGWLAGMCKVAPSQSPLSGRDFANGYGDSPSLGNLELGVGVGEAKGSSGPRSV